MIADAKISRFFLFNSSICFCCTRNLSRLAISNLKRIYHSSILKDDTYCIEVNKVKEFGILNCNNNWLQNFLIINNCVLAFLCRAVRVWLDWVITNWSLGCLCICNLSCSSARTFSLRLISCTCLFVSGKSLIGVIVFLRQSTFFRERTRL